MLSPSLAVQMAIKMMAPSHDNVVSTLSRTVAACRQPALIAPSFEMTALSLSVWPALDDCLRRFDWSHASSYSFPVTVCGVLIWSTI